MELIDVVVSTPRPGAAVIDLRGEHDLVTKDELSALVANLVDTHELVVIDVTRAKFIDSSVVTTVLTYDRIARERGKKLRLQVGTTAVVRRMLEVTSILAIVEHANTREEALA
jgi:anti-anti-sigma factor